MRNIRLQFRAKAVERSQKQFNPFAGILRISVASTSVVPMQVAVMYVGYN